MAAGGNQKQSVEHIGMGEARRQRAALSEQRVEYGNGREAKLLTVQSIRSALGAAARFFEGGARQRVLSA
ncbi:unnamed protein product [Strongylus vulgaris]|uniref:Uncharacterized protein n=1 Tax=Strongylus vulgaris TaxID=40348 RepID=A0A3P7IM91_STRVU|nr:unnamed protein product [Strongylus vulgaris]